MCNSLFVTWQGVAVQLLVLITSIALYRRYFAPLSGVPGPFWASITRLWHVKHIFQGKQNLLAISLHEKHGHFVRIAPNEVSVSHPDGPKLLLQAPLRKVLPNPVSAGHRR